MIEFRCKCGAKYRVPVKHAGKSTKCKRCNESVSIPLVSETEHPDRHRSEKETIQKINKDLPVEIGNSESRESTKKQQFFDLRCGECDELFTFGKSQVGSEFTCLECSHRMEIQLPSENLQVPVPKEGFEVSVGKDGMLAAGEKSNNISAVQSLSLIHI